ncbi:hypothetical protein ACFWBF_35180 [Streptomyces sp. NPDC060028]|uniref:hypothetical protein n=1 Tax=Streptomyces sp. NPDC060028 TaxID=3347041 RepID=UPI0036C20A96
MSQTTVASPLSPLTPTAVMSAFGYLRAVQAGDTEVAAKLVAAEPRMPVLLADVAEQIVVPVTALPDPDDDEPCADTFALEALGHVFLATLRTWQQAGPGGAQGIAQAVIGFIAEVLTEDQEDLADNLAIL